MDEKSDYYKERKRCLCELIVPSMSEIKERWGSAFSEAFFEQCPAALKPDLGLTPPLKGAGDDLWTSPSDLLIGKVCLKPPITSRYIKALTHEGILEIGRIIEQKYWNEMELDKKRALEEQEELLNFMCEREKKRAVEKARREEKEFCAEEMERMEEEFRIELEAQLAELETRMLAEQERLLQEQCEELERVWQEKLEQAVQETIESLTIKFLEDLKWQEQLLKHQFAIELSRQELKMKVAIDNERKFCDETFHQLKHNLECKNVANLMYTLCMERRKCQTEREAAELEYQKEVNDLQEEILENEITIGRLEEEKREKEKQANIREQCLLEIIRHFQKFINFSLRAEPTQAEFLLNIEKIMLFELTQAVAEAGPKHGRRIAKKLKPWKEDHETQTTTTTTTSTKLEVKDHHACFNELTPPPSERSLKSTDELPAFYYNQHMYVREDFRNMISQGIEISPSSLLWNKDVEHLMQLLRRSVSGGMNIEEENREKISDSERSKEDMCKNEEEVYSFNESILSAQPYNRRRSSVRFVKRKSSSYDSQSIPFFANNDSVIFDSNPLEFSYVKSKRKSIESSRTYADNPKLYAMSKSSLKRRSTLKYGTEELFNIDFQKIGEEENKKTLISARNSLEIHRESLMKLKKEKEGSEGTVQTTDLHSGLGILAVTDSLHKHRMSLKLNDTKNSLQEDSFGNISPTTFDTIQSSFDEGQDFKLEFPKPLSQCPSTTESRLTLARDSIIVNKQSLMLKTLNAEADSKLSLAKDSLELVLSSSKSASRKTSNGEPSNKRYSRVSLKMPSKSSLKKISKLSLEPPIRTSESHSPSESIRDPAFSPKPQTSKLVMARDSADLLRTSLRSLTEPLQEKTSRLSMHKNSFDVYRMTKMSKDSVEITNGGLISGQIPTRFGSPTSIIKLEDDGSRAVRMSHIEIVNIPEHKNLSNVSFKVEPTVYETESLESMEFPWKIYDNKEPEKEELQRDNFLTKPNVAKIIGDKQAKEHLQKSKDFTLYRANSFLKLIKDQPDLIKMFTSCTK